MILKNLVIGALFSTQLLLALACSSSDDDKDKSDDSGSAAGSSASGSTGGTSSTSSTGGTGSGGGGGSGGSGTPQADGTACAATTPNDCVDDANVQTCSEGKLITFNCKDAALELGFDSTGCTVAADGEGCEITPLDPKCDLGTAAYCLCAACSDEQALELYVSCYYDEQGRKEILYCIEGTVDQEQLQVDCDAAEACIPVEQTGGTGGTGGSTGGAGGSTGGTGGSTGGTGGSTGGTGSAGEEP